MGKTKRAILRTLRDIAVIAAGVYAVLCAYLYFRQSSFVFHPDRDLGATPKQLRLAFEDLTLTTADGVKIGAWYIPADKAAGTVLFCHGNAENISGGIETVSLLHKLAVNVLVFDYRGYGRSEGQPTEQGTYRDAEAAWDYLVGKLGQPPGRIVIHGRSLGGAVAAHLARDRTPAGLIVESSFTSVPDMGVRFYPMFPVRLLSKFQYATAEYLPGAKCPVLVIHSPQDDIVPFEMGQRLFAAAHPPKQFVEITGSHNEGSMQSERIYEPALRDFLRQVFRFPSGQAEGTGVELRK
jgi:uncharacterized protein